MLMLLVVLATQTGRTAVTDTIAGMVSGPGGRPLAGAIMQATSAITGLSRWRTSDAAGGFTIPFPGRAQYPLTPYYFGLVRGLGGGGGPVWARGDRPPPPPPASPPRPVRVTRRDVTRSTGVSTAYETTLPPAPAGLDSSGALLGVGGDFRSRSGHTTLEAQYDGVFRRYTATDLWNLP